MLQPAPPATDLPALEDDSSIVAIENFIQATRDSGYKTTSTAVAELVDNALDAGAQCVDIWVTKDDAEELPLQLQVLDDGSGMDAAQLRQALRFGGSSRFNTRADLGRFGMGLPNASLSQAQRVDVYTWRAPGEISTSYLDVDEIAAGRRVTVPEPESAELPPELQGLPGRSGTLVVWRRCDRLDNRRVSTLARKLQVFLGRVYRHYLWDGITLRVNGVPVRPIDPLFLSKDSRTQGGTAYGSPRVHTWRDVESDAEGRIEIRFSELPVAEWHHLSNKEKRLLGVTKGGGVSVVRGKREIEYGWLLMGGKRRENYDDWWRCEIRFEPSLDSTFGITHTKQQIRPHAQLIEHLVPQLEAIAKQLNSRVRRAHQELQAAGMSEADSDESESISGESRWSVGSLRTERLYAVHYGEQGPELELNPAGPLHQALDEEEGAEVDWRVRLEQVLLTAGQAEAELTTAHQQAVLGELHAAWARCLAALQRS